MKPVSVGRLVAPRKGLFLVSRTSYWMSEEPPVDGAVMFQTIAIDRRYVDDPKKIPAHKGTDGDWYTRGENHRVENGMICRDIGLKNQWFVEIPDVMEFVRKHGDCVVSVDVDGQESIEIYDDYRE